jgi:hypothetical protein
LAFEAKRWCSRIGYTLRIASSPIPLRLLAALRQSPVFGHARIEQSSCRSPSRLIIGIGQLHGVGQGRFERFQARRIAAIQAWIFEACAWFANQGVLAFGQEGFSRPGEEAFYGRLPADALKELKEAVREPAGVRRYLRRTASRWHTALRRGDTREVNRCLKGLNALSLLQALDERVVVFPLEQQDVHGPLSEALQALHARLERIERQPAYQSVIQKHGKGLTREEYTLAVEQQSLVQEYNAVLKDPQRDEAILEEILRYADQSPVTVFILGQGHKQAMKALMKQHLPSDTAFAWITPPTLWRPVVWRRTALAIFFGSLLAYALWWPAS